MLMTEQDTDPKLDTKANDPDTIAPGRPYDDQLDTNCDYFKDAKLAMMDGQAVETGDPGQPGGVSENPPIDIELRSGDEDGRGPDDINNTGATTEDPNLDDLFNELFGTQAISTDATVANSETETTAANETAPEDVEVELSTDRPASASVPAEPSTTTKTTALPGQTPSTTTAKGLYTEAPKDSSTTTEAAITIPPAGADVEAVDNGDKANPVDSSVSTQGPLP
uniref:Uncharacterized protein n=1 Tax=Romanomermis culicivorax TaxID=13658 RepID=A0A915KA63_ROMCU